jgi:hypothetical protein
MLDRRLTDDEDAPYKKLYRMSIPDEASPPVSLDPPEDTVQAMYAEEGEVLVSFDPKVLEWYPSVVVLLPQHELFEYLLAELQRYLDPYGLSEIIQLSGQMTESGFEVQTGSHEASTSLVSLYATSQSKQRLSLNVSLPTENEAEKTLRRWFAVSDSGS